MSRGCGSCRHHSKQERPLEASEQELRDDPKEDWSGVDREFTQATGQWIVSDETETVVFCMARDSKAMGPLSAEPGADCDLFEAGSKGLSPELEKLLRSREER